MFIIFDQVFISSNILSNQSSISYPLFKLLNIQLLQQSEQLDSCHISIFVFGSLILLQILLTVDQNSHVLRTNHETIQLFQIGQLNIEPIQLFSLYHFHFFICNFGLDRIYYLIIILWIIFE